MTRHVAVMICGITAMVLSGGCEEDVAGPPGGELHPDVLVQPGTLSNVKNGSGFVTGGYNDEAPLYPSTRSIDDTGFFDFVGGRIPVVTGCGRYVGG